MYMLAVCYGEAQGKKKNQADKMILELKVIFDLLFSHKDINSSMWNYYFVNSKNYYLFLLQI